MKKVILSAIFAVYAFCTSVASIEVNGIYYTISGTTATVTSNPSKYTGEVVIPETITYNDVTYDVTAIGDTAFYLCDELTAIILPTNLKTIGYSAFRGCSSLTGDLVIPNSVTIIGNSAFQGCGFSGTLTLSESLRMIRSYAFQNCSGFTGDLVIPENVTSIGTGIFEGCSGFDGSLFFLGNKLTSISMFAFADCSGLTGDLIIPSRVTSIEFGAFRNCKGFTGSLTLSENLTEIQNTAFNGCSGFTGKLTIPSGVTSMGNYAFSNCSGFTGDVVIPAGVTTLGIETFTNCKGLSKMYVLPTTPPWAHSNAFRGITYTTKLIVPCGTVDAYKAATGWNTFTYIRDYEYVVTLKTASAAQGTAALITRPCEADGYATFQGVGTEGYEFDHWNDGSIENPRTEEITEDITYTASFRPLKPIIDWGAYQTQTMENSVQGVTVYLRDFQAVSARVIGMDATDVRITTAVQQNADGTQTILLTDEQLTALAGEKIAMQFYGADNNALDGYSNRRVPIIVATNQDMSTLQAADPTKPLSECDIVVKAGATLTCASDTTVRNLLVDAGAKLLVTNDATLTISQVLSARSEIDVQPQLQTEGNASIVYPKFQFIKRIPQDRYYFFSLPFNCSNTNVTFLDTDATVYDTNWHFLYYDGAGFAQNPSNTSYWCVDETKTITPQQGYAIAVATGEGVTDNKNRDIIFETTATLDFSQNTSRSVAVAENPIQASNTHPDRELFKGWNFIMNPYTSDFNANNGTLIVPGADIAYVTMPDPGQDKTYTQYAFGDISHANLTPFFGFYVQTQETGNVIFTPDGVTSPAQEAPRKIQCTQSRAYDEPLFIGVKLSNGEKSDETSLVVSNKYTEAYEIGSDLQKMLGYADKPQVYTYNGTTKYAFKSINEQVATQTHPLGVYLPVQGDYTFSLKDSYDYSRVTALYLYDYEAEQCVDLMQTDYAFTSGALNSEKRFALSPRLAPSITTSLLSEANSIFTVLQDAPLHLCINGIAQGSTVRIINMQGQVVNQWIATDSIIACTVPQCGLYIVEVTATAGVQLKKVTIQ